MITFAFKNLTEFGTWLENLSKEKVQVAKSKLTLRESRFEEGQAHAYRDLARMISEDQIKMGPQGIGDEL